MKKKRLEFAGLRGEAAFVSSEFHLSECTACKLLGVSGRAAESRLTRANQQWAMDFIVDGLATGQMVRILSVVDA